MDIKAAIVRGQGQPFELGSLQLDALRPDEVRVRLVATGVCHTDAIVRDQVYPTPLPAVLGHEGAGIVEAVGSEVTAVEPGDAVVLSANSCGVCEQCLKGRPPYCTDFFGRNFGGTRPDGSSAFSDAGTPVSSHFFGQSSFATHVNAAQRTVVKVDRDLPLELLGPLGCGLQTGAGAVINSLDVRPGSSLAVFGTGAVGCAALMAAAAVGATTIIAVDIVDSRLATAMELGATHVINSRTTDVGAEIARISQDRGVDYALDTTGIPAVLRQAADILGIGGTVALIGAPAPGTEVSFEVGASLIKGWHFRTIVEGDSVPQVFIPQLIRLWQQGKFPIEKLTKTFAFSDINDAFAASASGETIKPVILF
ncbi:NAD(P)-dependent alcohol dehydrogenase [Arthrobacter cavernae]|uniref:NAD(P)-dependent alcohol dehydrogenase n=1 Tax=Arthrobacter cavernae TaxID=2817681 RepID=A0A939KM27_9MICC|nr:NAD(P)-dependent alcohol dehydrogenase [Arthrobacter cavernae]MBO1267781.1 NAD(P)-dependent alcohol dehydrogenase [Arthrobacter cavernae]